MPLFAYDDQALQPDYRTFRGYSYTSGPKIQTERITINNVVSENHTQTLLEDGRVLIIGGITEGTTLNNVKIYTPQGRLNSIIQDQTWQEAAPISIGRHRHTATLLSDGNVLVVGGQHSGRGTSSVEVYRPRNNTWHNVSSLNHARYNHTATLLNDGRVLVVGGVGGIYVENSVEIYDPDKDEWTELADLNMGRYGHQAVILPDGRVIVAGGYISQNGILRILNNVEFYDPATKSWTEIASMAEPRINHTATLLPNGHLIVIAGDSDLFSDDVGLASVEILDTTQDILTTSWQQAASLDTAVQGHAATLLPKSSDYPDGAVLVSGGLTPDGFTRADVLIYDPTIGKWGYWQSEVPLTISRYNHTATLLHNNHILMAGGTERDSNNISSAVEVSELYDLSPETFEGRWSPVAPINTSRYFHTATRLQDERILIVGGVHAGTSVEIYDPTEGAVGTWRLATNIEAERYHHTATLLEDGRTVILGGTNSDGVTLDSVEVFNPDPQPYGSWEKLPDLKNARYRHQTILLHDGRLLVVGGRGSMETIELYDLTASRFNPAWTDGPPLSFPRDHHTATLLRNGKVLVVGGRLLNGGLLKNVELYDPRQDPLGAWKEVSPLHEARGSHSATLLPDGRVLILGGIGDGNEILSSAEIYDPSSNQWQIITPMHSARHFPTASVLDDQTVLVIGSVGATTSAEVLDLGASEKGIWHMVAPLHLSYARHTATQLANGQILALGSVNQTIVEIFDQNNLSRSIIPSLQVTKFNDADGDNRFSTVEEAELGTDDIQSELRVPFHLSITNTSPIDVKILEINNSIGGYNYEYTDTSCAELEGNTLSSGQNVDCIFDTFFIGNDAMQLRSVTQVVVQSDGNQTGVSKDETLITTQDILPSIRITQTSDANGDAIFAEYEEAPKPSDTVTFRLDIFNDGLEDVYIEQIPEPSSDDLMGHSVSCTSLDRIPLRPGEQISCLFEGFSPFKDATTEYHMTNILIKDDDRNEAPISTSSGVGTADQKLDIYLNEPVGDPEGISPGQLANCNVTITNRNPYERVTLQRIQTEMKIVPPEGPPVVKADIATDCQGPKPINKGADFVCQYNQEVQGVPGSEVSCVVAIIVEDDDNNQTSIQGTFNRYIIIDNVQTPTALPQIQEPSSVSHFIFLPQISN